MFILYLGMQGSFLNNKAPIWNPETDLSATFALQTARITPLHFQTVQALRSTLGDPQFLKVDVRRVVNNRLGPSRRSLLGQEKLKLVVRHALGDCCPELCMKSLAEAVGIRGLWLVEISLDLRTDLIARVEDAHSPLLLALEMDAVKPWGDPVVR